MKNKNEDIKKEIFKKLQDIWSIVNPKPTPNSSDFKLTVKREI